MAYDFPEYEIMSLFKTMIEVMPMPMPDSLRHTPRFFWLLITLGRHLVLVSEENPHKSFLVGEGHRGSGAAMGVQEVHWRLI